MKMKDCTIDDLIQDCQGTGLPDRRHDYGKEQYRKRCLSHRTGKSYCTCSRPRSKRLPAADQQIIVTEIPYQVNKARLIEKIAELVKDKRVDGISDIRDESSSQRRYENRHRTEKRCQSSDYPQSAVQAYPTAGKL